MDGIHLLFLSFWHDPISFRESSTPKMATEPARAPQVKAVARITSYAVHPLAGHSPLDQYAMPAVRYLRSLQFPPLS
jgi:hypothetical protein